MKSKNMTGYPHLDKPWMKYYDENFTNLELPKMNIYDYMKSHNSNLDNIAINFFGNKISYGALNEEVDNASKVLKSLGVKKDDRIMYLMPNIPETAYLMYGGAQIGAISDYVDPRPDSVDMKISAQKILDLFREERCKYIIALDQCYLEMIKPIENELKEMGVENIVIVSASNSMNLNSTINYINETASFEGLLALKQKLKRTKQLHEMVNQAKKSSCIKVLDYNDLTKNNRYTIFDKIGYIPNKTDIIVHTSGTTSPKPKAIPLTNDNLNSYVFQTFYGNMPMQERDKALHILPYFAAFGIVDVVHAGLCHSNELIQVPEFSPSNLGKLILKYKPQTIIGTPTWFVNLMNDSVMKHANLSFIKMITYGGDSMSIEDELAINEFLAQHKCSVPLTKGHGMSELCGCSSYSIGDYNIPGSLGIPMPKTIYTVVDPETKEFKKFVDGINEIEGELAISSPCATQGTLDDKIIVPHVTIDGIDFIFTNDIAKMNRDGIMTFLSRNNRAFTRFDGFKVKPYEIEQVINSFENIKSCIITPYFSEREHGNMIMANIVLNNNMELFDNEEKVEFVERLIDKCFIKNPDVSTRQIPTKFKFLDSMPITQNGKVDYNELIKTGITGDEITVELEETNISINSIKVLAQSGKSKKLLFK